MKKLIKVSLINRLSGLKTSLEIEQLPKDQTSVTKLFSILNPIVGEPEALEIHLNDAFFARKHTNNRFKTVCSFTMALWEVKLELPVMEHEKHHCDAIFPSLLSITLLTGEM